MKKNKIPYISPMLFAGVLLVLLPIFIFMGMERIERQNELITQKMVEKGMALIRTFEAGTRTGMFTMRWGANRIQAMLQETASQPEVEYITIVSKDGEILAHSEPGLVGQIFENMPQVESEDVEHFSIYHRINNPADGHTVFEVYKRFVPVKRRFMHKNRPRHHMPGMMMQTFKDQADGKKDPKDWCQNYFNASKGGSFKMAEHYIFTGLSMEKGLALQNKLLKQTVFRTVILFLIGCAGMITLFAFQAYRSAKASLTSVQAFSDNVIQNMPSGLVTIDSQHKITSMNHAARQIFGQDLAGPFPEWIELIYSMDQSKPIASKEINIEKERGKNIRLEMIASPIKEGEDQTTGFLFLFRDLSQIRELQKQVETNKRLAAIGKLAAGVAHEIRNPLSSIKGFATYFAKRYQENDSDLKTAKIMVGEVERINRSITQLLEFAKPMSIEKKMVNIEEMVNHSLRLVEHDIEQKQIETHVEIIAKRKMISTDPDRMNQVFLNLYINAIEAMEEKGSLTVCVKEIERGRQIEIAVKDNGIGMDEISLDRIFDPYFTTRPSGTGLGLSIVHTIIENLNGTIRVQSQKGEGSSFIIHLPVEDADKPDQG